MVHAVPPSSRVRYATAKQVAIAAATALITLNIWTGAPLAAMWIGSKAAGQSSLSMLGVSVVVLALAALDFGLTMALTWLGALYREIAGLPPTVKRSIGLRSVPAEVELDAGRRRAATLEGIVVINVYVAFAALIIWYVFFSSAPFSLVL
ncbi:MAG TPA: hypothetical protein VHT29_08230 [Solirubrobacteraceae bacterium]|nr:hypothetical protein [Solirubrobacteraceae bacterium]